MKGRRLLRRVISAGFVAALLHARPLEAIDTVGCYAAVDPATFNHAGLTQLTWAADILEYDSVPANPNPFRLRIDFMDVGFMGRGFGASDPYPFMSITTAIQNVGHTFTDDSAADVGTFPGLGLYLSSLQAGLGDNQHGVALRADPQAFPRFGRVFQNVDGGGFSGKNIYSRQTIGVPSAARPISVRWTVQKVGTATNPPLSLSKDILGRWVPLSGTFVIWHFQVAINGVTTDVSDYYLPIEKAEYIWSYAPLTFVPEQFGSASQILQAQKSTVRFSDMRASDGTAVYPILDWFLSYCIDDQAGNRDPHYGWRTDGLSLTDSVGHADDPTASTRTVGTRFALGVPSVPEPPSGLQARVTDSTVLLKWVSPTSGNPPTSYVIQAGSRVGTSNLANVSTNTTLTSYTANDVPDGTYFVRVLASNAVGVSLPSNEIAVSVLAGCVAPPVAPANLTFSLNGSTVNLGWNASAGASSYVVQAGTTFGTSNIAAIDTGNALPSLSAVNVPSATYYVRVLAKNSCGLSPPSNEIVFSR